MKLELKIGPFLILIGCLLAPTLLRAEPLNLQQAVELALAHAPAMQAAVAGRDASAEDSALGRAWLLPYAELRGSIQRRKNNTVYDIPQNLFKTDLNYNQNSIGVRVVQSLFDLERWAGYRQGELSAEAGELKLQLERQRLILETSQAFLAATTAQTALTAASAREAAAEKLALQAEVARQVGTAALPERLDAETRRDMAKADRLRAENELNQARAVLASLTGSVIDELTPPQVAQDDQSDQDTSGTSGNSEPWESKAATQAIAVKLAQVQFGVAKEGRKKALGGALPKVELFGEVSRDRSGDTMLDRGATVHNQAIGIQVKVPLYAGGGTSAQMRKSEKEALQAEFSLTDDIRLARLTTRQAFLNRKSAEAQVQAMHQATLSAGKSSEMAHRGYEVGMRSMTEVLDADERAFTAEKNLSAAIAQYVFASLQLQASVGELTSKSLPETFGGDTVTVSDP